MTTDDIIASARAECERRGMRGDEAVIQMLAGLALEYRKHASIGMARPFVDWSKVGQRSHEPSAL